MIAYQVDIFAFLFVILSDILLYIYLYSVEKEKAELASKNRGRRSSEIEITKFGLKKVESKEVCYNYLLTVILINLNLLKFS